MKNYRVVMTEEMNISQFLADLEEHTNVCWKSCARPTQKEALCGYSLERLSGIQLVGEPGQSDKEGRLSHCGWDPKEGTCETCQEHYMCALVIDGACGLSIPEILSPDDFILKMKELYPRPSK